MITDTILLTMTDLDMIFTHGVPHEHGVEGGHLVDPHPWHANHLRHVVHGRDGEPASVLTLSKIQQGDHLK